MPLNVRVITPDKTVWDEPVEEIVLPSITGQLGILPGHAPLLSGLDIGVMRVRAAKEWKAIAVAGGFAEIDNDTVKILVNSAELGEKIDQEAARTQYETAQKSFDTASKSGDLQEKIKADRALKKARARFQASGGLVRI